MPRDMDSHLYDTSGVIDSTGSANAYVVTVDWPINAYHRGMPPIRFKANFGNTGAATLNVATINAPSGLGAVNLRKLGGGTALATGDIISGGVYTVIYDGAAFQVLELNTGVLATANIADDAITYAKIQNVSATSRVLGRKTAGAGDVEELTLSEVLDFVGSAAQGDILYRGASAWTRLAAGTNRQRLLTGGSGANPSWGGGAVGLFSGSLSGSTVDITNIPSHYTMLLLSVASFSFSGAGASLRIQGSDNNGSSFDTTAGNYTGIYHVAGASPSALGAATFADPGALTLAADTGFANLMVRFYQTSGTRLVDGNTTTSGGGVRWHQTQWFGGSGGALNAIRLAPTAGTFDGGTYSLTGIL